MDRKIILPMLAVILLVLAAAILLPGGRQADTDPKLPWKISITATGQSEVFGLTLGSSTLKDARQILGSHGELTLFRSPDTEFAAEAYFQRTALSGLRADFVLSLELPKDVAAQMFERGLRLSTLGSGVQKVELSEPDRQQLAASAVSHLTYIPATDLDEALIQRHFGTPESTIAEPDGIVHWLYPSRGLDIALNPEGKEVLQYLQPDQFERIVAPLRSASEANSR